MQIREVVLKYLAVVVEENSPLPFTEQIEEEMLLEDFWLDSIAFTSLVTGIESEVGFIPLAILKGTDFPRTIGELVQMYENEALVDR